MKRIYPFIYTFVIVFIVNTSSLCAQNSWAMAVIKRGQDKPLISEYRCLPEIGKNTKSYYRIYDANYITEKNHYYPLKLQYGYRLEDKHIYVYDFDSNEEHLAFDFTLKEGDTFQTYNGIDWIVESANDTLVNVSFKGLGDMCSKRLLKVRSIDGNYEDQWIEDFGSLSNHFMILPLNETDRVFTLWIESESMGCYLINEISSDPLYTHDFGFPNENEKENLIGTSSCSYTDNELTVEYSQFRSTNREYKCFYRRDKNFYYAFVWALNPALEISDEPVLENSSFCFYGVPPLNSGEYIVNFNYEDGSNTEANDIQFIRSNAANAISRKISYDIFGRKLPYNASNGIKIIEGKKIRFIRHFE